MKKNSIKLRNPNINDGSIIWELIRDCKPLDLNSSYLYLLLCQHFSETCFVAERDSQLVGFVSAYKLPKLANVIFIWQIAVHESMRGQGLAKLLLRRLLQQSCCQDIKYIETTVLPSNEAAKNLFYSFAREFNIACKENPFFAKEFFPREEGHEEEILFQLGPLR